MKKISAYIVLIIIIVLAERANGDELYPYNQFRNKWPEFYESAVLQIEKNTHVWDSVIEHYKKQLNVQMSAKPIFPWLLVSKDAPNIRVVITSIGGDGEHSLEHSYVFRKRNRKYELFAIDIPYFINEFHWNEVRKGLLFRGELLIDFCDVCDGPSVSSPDAQVVIPLKGLIQKDKRPTVEFSGGPYQHRIVQARLNSLTEAHKEQWSELKSRIELARSILQEYKHGP